MPDFPIRIGFCAPSRAVIDVSTPALAKLYFQDHGAEVVLHDTVFKNIKQFAGTEDERLEGLMSMACNPDIDLVMPIRGGYGLSRILDRIDFEAIAAADPVFCGYSDFTAFNLAYFALTGKVSYQGPNGTDFVDSPLYFTEKSFHSALFAEEWTCSFACREAPPSDMEGILWGGNLSMIVSLLGSKYFPQVDGGILFLEDCNDRAYRLERSLMQLDMAGVLSRQKAILLGDFRDSDPAHPKENDFLFADVLVWMKKRLPHVTILTGLPFGHSPVKATLPVGAKVRMRTEKGFVVLSTFDHPRVTARFDSHAHHVA